MKNKNTYVAGYNLGTVLVTKFDKYKTFDDKNATLQSAINFLYPKDELDLDEDDVFTYNHLNIKAGSSIGILLAGDSYDLQKELGVDLESKLYAIIDFKQESVIFHDGDRDHTGEVNNFLINLGDKFFSDSGEYVITTPENQEENELDHINEILGTNFSAVIISYS